MLTKSFDISLGSEFNTEYLVPWKLFLLAVCILAFRRLPFLLAIHRGIPALPDLKQALFAGWSVCIFGVQNDFLRLTLTILGKGSDRSESVQSVSLSCSSFIYLDLR